MQCRQLVQFLTNAFVLFSELFALVCSANLPTVYFDW